MAGKQDTVAINLSGQRPSVGAMALLALPSASNAMEVNATNSAALQLWASRALGFLASLASLASEVEAIWVQVRVYAVAPVLKVAVVLCMAMSIMLVLEKVVMGLTSLFAKVFRRWRQGRYKYDSMADSETGSPMVLVQLPMYNERQVYKLSLGAACRLTWPSHRIIIQVLDDSTDPDIKNLVELECKKWESKGVNIKYEKRDNRHGYKAGALKEGMKYSYVGECDFVAIFDADFQPEEDFLEQTIPFLVHNPRVGLVQARWKFVNSDECLMTRIQEMSMDYHFKVEQESGSTMNSFFGFNGTAGVWRISALKDAGGWNDRTTVEDMDLAVRATLRGWDFIYAGNIKVRSELPSTFMAYRNQQYRWSCGSANLFIGISKEIITTNKLPLWRKIDLLYSFFIVRRILSHIVTFTFYCVVIPFSVFIPEVKVSKWGVVYIPTTITLLHSVGTPSSFHLLFFWVLFENVMAMQRTRAVVAGLLGVGEVNEWIVTEKLGTKLKVNEGEESSHRLQVKNRFLLPELGMSLFLFICASYDMWHAKNSYFFFIYPQAITFFIVGIGYVGTLPSS